MMKDKIKGFFSKFAALIRRARGKKVVEIKFLGIQLFLIAKPGEHNWNIFLLYLPLFRFDAAPHRYGFNLLVLTWVFKVLRNLFTKWELVRTANSTHLRFCGISLYRRTEVVPYRFPSSLFRG